MTVRAASCRARPPAGLAPAVAARSRSGAPARRALRSSAPATGRAASRARRRSIHGNETAGHAVVPGCGGSPPPAGVQLWLVRRSTPTGSRAGTRQNARGVDLNRNFPFRWRGGGRPFDTYFPGRAPASEPETRAVQRLVARVRPDLTVYYHQHMRLVVLPRAADTRRCATTAAASGSRRPSARLPRDGDRLAEPPIRRDRVRRRAARRARSRRRGAAAPRAGGARVARAGRPARRAGAPPPRPSRRSSGTDPVRRRGAGRCGPTRGATTACRGARCGDPKVIVEHYTASTTFARRSTRSRPTRPTSSRRAARRLRALRDRPRRDDPPARLAALALPPHRRAQRHRDRDRARRRLRRRRHGPARAARRLARLTR